MEHDVFILNDEMFYAWDVRFTAVEQHRESSPCRYYEPEGVFRKGKMYYTLESAEVVFLAPPDSIKVGQSGQLSSTDDQFYEVTVSSLQPAGDHILVCGHATRKFAYEKDR